MQIDLVPQLPRSGGYENIVTAMDVFFRYFLAYPTWNQDAITIAKVLNIIMTKHDYLPTTLNSDKGTAFMSHVLKEVAGVLGIPLKHATTKHAQTIGLPDRSHGSIKQALEIETGKRRLLRHKYVSIAVLSYNTTVPPQLLNLWPVKKREQLFVCSFFFRNVDHKTKLCIETQVVGNISQNFEI